MRERAVNPAAQAALFPPKVLACEPGGQVITSSDATVAPRGSPPPSAFERQTMSGTTPNCSDARKVPVRKHPDCTSSAMRRISYLSHISRRRFRNVIGGTTYPPSPCMGSTTIAATSSGETSIGKISSSIYLTTSRSQVAVLNPNGR